jgi:hypothetical protein
LPNRLEIARVSATVSRVSASFVSASFVSASFVGALLASALLATAASAVPPSLNGFALEPADIDVAEILSGGPARDGIPALDAPQTTTADAASLPGDERVIGVVLGGEARAYPLSILVWHELVNDTLGGQPILESYCPLCGTGLVFDRRRGERALRFGVSGLLYRSDLLMFDRETESLWSQIGARAVTGKRRGERLQLVRSRILPWAAWRRRHPETTILSPRTGHLRNYGASPYGDYDRSRQLLFGLKGDARYHPKTRTLGLRFQEGPPRAYPAEELERAGGSVEENVGGHRVRVAWDSAAAAFDVEAPPDVEVIEGFWFAWAAFHPRTSVFQSTRKPGAD